MKRKLLAYIFIEEGNKLLEVQTVQQNAKVGNLCELTRAICTQKVLRAD